MATPTPSMLGGVSGTPLYSMPADNDNLKDVYGGKEMPEGLPELKMEDMAVSRDSMLLTVSVTATWSSYMVKKQDPNTSAGAGLAHAGQQRLVATRHVLLRLFQVDSTMKCYGVKNRVGNVRRVVGSLWDCRLCSLSTAIRTCPSCSTFAPFADLWQTDGAGG
jgi:hypothetical protein